jgi:hypothetical protein
VTEGRQKSAAGALQVLQQRNLSLIGTSIGDGSALYQDAQTQLTVPTALNDATISPQGQTAGNKCSNPESVGSYMSRRQLAKVVTSLREQSSLRHDASSYVYSVNRQNIIHGTCELDSHADTSVTGPNCTVIEYTDQRVSVSGFSNEYEAIHDVPIVTAATTYDDPNTGTTVVLIIGQALYLNDKVSCTLLCPNQLRSNGISVDDIPVHLAPRNQPTKHGVFLTFNQEPRYRRTRDMPLDHSHR